MKANINLKESFLLKDSLDQSFILFKDDEKKLILNIYKENSQITVDKNILDFSAAIDENNKLHLIYLQENGDLVYCVYSEDGWQKNLIGKLDVQSNIYRYLTLLIHKNTINIFYAFSNIINLNLWTIEHILKSKDNSKKYVVANIFSEKIIDPFYIDSDEFGNIYLVYSGKEYNNYNIYYLFFNNFTKIWTTNPAQISSSLADNILPYLFVDTHNNVHILWYSSNNKNYFLKYKRFASFGNNKFQWKEINLPKILGNNYPALMIEKNNRLNLVYISEEKVFNLISNDFGNTWALEDETYVKQYPIYLIKYYDTSSNKTNNKINYYYGNVDNGFISVYFDNLQYTPKKDSVELKNTNHKNEIINTESPENEIKFDSDIDINIDTDIESKEFKNLINTLEEMQEQLKLIKNEIKVLKDKIEDIEEKFNDKKRFFRIW